MAGLYPSSEVYMGYAYSLWGDYYKDNRRPSGADIGNGAWLVTGWAIPVWKTDTDLTELLNKKYEEYKSAIREFWEERKSPERKQLDRIEKKLDDVRDMLGLA